MRFLLPLFVGWVVVWSAGWILPARYKSSTLILVQEPSMPMDYVKPNISGDLQDRLQSITQQILSRTRLVSIIEKLHLYESKRRVLTVDEQVEMMRKDIEIELVHDAHQEQITAFRINYSAESPSIAQQVTSELTDLFIKENLQVRQRESQDTTEFIVNQVESARQMLAEQEQQIREFKARHQGELPSQQASNLQILGGLQAQLQNEQDALNSARQQGVYLQTLMDQYQTVRGGRDSAADPAGGLPGIEKRLDTLRAQLANLSAHYTERYPEIQTVREEIARTEKMRADLLADLRGKAEDGKRSAGEGAAVEVLDSPALLQLKSQLQANKVDVSTREHAIAELKARINEYQGRLNSVPAREQELADLSRGYEQSKANYDDLLKKKNQSQMATSMEQMQQGERFSMIDPPSFPLKPYFPNRMKLCGIGLGAGVGLGLLVVMGFELSDGRLHREADIRKLVPVPILASIPVIVVASEEQASRRRMALGWATAALISAMILTGSAFSYLHK